ncbi:class I SAM-dependent methyltransferase [Dysgonomonas sp. Marseille-P4361]|uniref:class I SAM-dependent methyltransferase n=1 Tax=Dysgonomonas sp. Marseille-P4361 TaxID=2161820 RepID=UPI000D5580B1|nr:class I SAM-dependent methyltransferase [Dysgonomonas sp. Marseille-P4361]
MLTPELLDFVKEHEKDDIRALALQAKKYAHIDMELAIRQIQGRKIAKDKLPTWYGYEQIIYPKHLSLEQSSSEQTALYKASLCSGDSLVDLTGGLGVDFSFMSKSFSKAIYVEQQEELTEIATENFQTLGLSNAEVINQDSVSYLRTMPKVDTIFIDPARRNNVGKKTVLIEDCTPNLIEIEDLLEEKAKEKVIIKLSPMLDITLALNTLEGITDVHIVSVNNECKELLFVKDKRVGEQPVQFHCINIRNDKTDTYIFTKEQEESAKINYRSNAGKYLYEPNASILKAGAYKSIVQSYGIDKLHVNSHLYSSDVLMKDFDGRILLINNILSFSKKDIKDHLSKIGQANITVRNFPLSVQEIRKKTKIKEGGDIYIFATTMTDEKKVLLVCEKIK